MNVRLLGLAGGTWALLLASASGGCSAEPASTPRATGGSVGAGGSPSTGGAASPSGAPGTGGLNSASGASATGGASAMGGAATMATGGAVTTATGGANVGGSGASGASATGGAASSAGAAGKGSGGVGSGGVSLTGGNGGGIATGGVSATGGSKATGGATAGGASSTGGAKAMGGATATGGAPNTTGCGTVVSNPFTSCKFAWGAPSSGSNSSYLNFVSTWIGDETNGGLTAFTASATNNACGDCSLVQSLASTNSMAVFYTYFIGFQACRIGTFCDCNTDTDGRTLCTDGAQWIRTHRAAIVNSYAQYAKRIYAVSPNKPTIWWLEGDYVQYSYTTQSNPLSYAELGALARDITCAIKSNQPNAVVAMNHSPWISNDEANGFWSAQPLDVLDLVWVQGPGDTDVFVNSGAYNATSANYAWLRQKTSKKIMAETSYAGSGQNDRWTTASAANIDARIANGVIGVLVNSPPSNYQSVTTSLSLSSTCN